MTLWAWPLARECGLCPGSVTFMGNAAPLPHCRGEYRDFASNAACEELIQCSFKEAT